MPTFAEKRVLPYTPEQLYRLVADVEHYPEFLPWCRAAKIRSRTSSLVVADLVIGYRMIRERFTSEVHLSPPDAIDVRYLEGPFRRMNNHWGFMPASNGGTEINFFVDFEFKSRVLQKLMEMFFNEAVRRMVSAFETRAKTLYSTENAIESKQPFVTPRPAS